MDRWLSIVLVGLGGLAIVACGGNGSDGPTRGTGGTGGTPLDCTTLMNPPSGCDDSCASGRDSECEMGTFCLNRVCSAQCTPTEGCGANSTCNARGRCVPDQSTGGTSGAGGSGCQFVRVTPSRSIPNVMFLVDRSGSMLSAFGGGTRWGVAHDAIQAVMTETQSIVSYGLATYHWNDDKYSLNNSPPDPECPIVGPSGGSVQTLEPIGFGLNNASTILMDYPAAFPDGQQQTAPNDTPTGESIDKLVAWINDNPPPPQGPTIIVLATDGEPDSCMYPDSNQSLARQLSVDAATDACAAQDSACTGIQTYVLSVGSQVGQDHLQDMANVGVGLKEDGSDGNAPFWVGTDPVGLERAFREIIGDSISCDVQMAERFASTSAACAEGNVQLDSVMLACTDADGDGWRPKPGFDDVIELVGLACETFKSGNVTFTADFPCGSIIVQ